MDPDRPRDSYTEIVAWGTGWPLPDDVYQECDYWGTCEDGYGYIWHYFAATRSSAREYADKVATTPGVVYNSPSAGSPNCPYGFTVSCNDANSAISALETKVYSDYATSIEGLQSAVEYLTAAMATGKTAAVNARM